MSQQVPELPNFCWEADTSCVPDWDALTDPDEQPGPDNPPRYSDAEKARAVALAGQSLRLLTGRRVGGCPITVRPCRPRCSVPSWRTFPASGGGSTPWMPVSLGGQWLNVGCGCASGGCGHDSAREVVLYGPASEVTEVRIGGLVLDPSAYRLDPGGRLVRTDGEAWPLTQNMSAPDTEPDTWSVTYRPGLPVDGLGAWAAGVLAGEYLAACAGGDCRLPASVTQIVRQGVTMTLAPGAFPEGKTGIRDVDAWIESVNPHGLRTPSTVWSPDLPRHRAVV